MSHAHPHAHAAGNRRPVVLYVVLGAVVALAAVLAIALGGGGGSSDEGGAHETAEVSVRGLELPKLEDPANDPAVGQPAPRLEGVDFDGDPVSVGDGTARAMMFVAHWCPHCQNEVPVVSQWLDAGGKPANVDLVMVATGTDENQPNYPPSAWLEREGLGDVPTIVDDEKATAAYAYGLSAYPYWVFVNADGTVSSRMTGELPVETIDAEIAKITP